MNKSIVGIIVLVLVIGGIVMMRGSGTATGQGKVVVAITDAAADMGNVTEVRMQVSKVELQSETEGWVTVSTDNKTFDLLKLKAEGRLALVATSDLKSGTYNQMRVMIDKIEVTTKDGVTTEAKLPSGEFKMNGDVTIVAGETSSVNLDFLADASLHMTGNGEFIFAPVVRMESRSNAEVVVASDETVTVTGGVVSANVTHGMDVSGEVRQNFRLDTSSGVDIKDDVIEIKALLQGGKTDDANTSTGAEVKIETKTEVNVGGGGKGSY